MTLCLGSARHCSEKITDIKAARFIWQGSSNSARRLQSLAQQGSHQKIETLLGRDRSVWQSAFSLSPIIMKFGSIGVVLGILGTRKLSLHWRAVQSQQNDPTAWLNRGLALSRDDTLTRSLVWPSIHLKPDFPKAWDKRGYALVQLGRDPEAIASFDKALNLSRTTLVLITTKRVVMLYRSGWLST